MRRAILFLGLALAAPARLLAQAVNVTGEWAFNVQTDQGGGTPTLLTGVKLLPKPYWATH